MLWGKGCKIKFTICKKQYVIKSFFGSHSSKTTATGSLREKCPNTEFFLFRVFLSSKWILENTDQKKLGIWALFTRWLLTQTLPKKCPYSELVSSAFFPHFLTFGLNAERYFVTLLIQSECGKMWTNTDQNNSKYEHFLSSENMF